MTLFTGSCDCKIYLTAEEKTRAIDAVLIRALDI